jgi:hypothetical protein
MKTGLQCTLRSHAGWFSLASLRRQKYASSAALRHGAEPIPCRNLHALSYAPHGAETRGHTPAGA